MEPLQLDGTIIQGALSEQHLTLMLLSTLVGNVSKIEASRCDGASNKFAFTVMLIFAERKFGNSAEYQEGMVTSMPLKSCWREMLTRLGKQLLKQLRMILDQPAGSLMLRCMCMHCLFRSLQSISFRFQKSIAMKRQKVTV